MDKIDQQVFCTFIIASSIGAGLLAFTGAFDKEKRTKSTT